MTITMKKKADVGWLFINTGFESGTTFDGVHTKKWQLVLSGQFHRKLQRGMFRIKDVKESIGFCVAWHNSNSVIDLFRSQIRKPRIIQGNNYKASVKRLVFHSNQFYPAWKIGYILKTRKKKISDIVNSLSLLYKLRNKLACVDNAELYHSHILLHAHLGML